MLIPHPKVLADATVDGVEVTLRELHDTDGTYWHVLRHATTDSHRDENFSRTFDDKDKAWSRWHTAVDELKGEG